MSDFSSRVAKLDAQAEPLRNELLGIISGAQQTYFAGYNQQGTFLRSQGLVKKGNFLLSESSVAHRVLLDHFEYAVLMSYLLVHEQIFDNIENPLSGFAMRTIIDIAYFLAPAVLSSHSIIPKELQDRYKIMITLKDCLLTTTGKQSKHWSYYLKLKRESLGSLKPRDLEELRKYEDSGSANAFPLAKYIDRSVKADIKRLLKEQNSSLTPKQGVVWDILESYYSELLHAGSAMLLRAELEYPRGERKRLLLLDSALAIVRLLARHDVIAGDEEFLKKADTVYDGVKRVYGELNILWKDRPEGSTSL